MPGSLLIPNDTSSERSDLSTRSLGCGKKVSFNKAVRVKQYPWMPDAVDPQAGDHMTLPNSRFWFKVYKNKQEPPQWSNQHVNPNGMVSWEEENMECIHDSLAPIAEDEDPDTEMDKPFVDPTIYDRFGRRVGSTMENGKIGIREYNGGFRNVSNFNGHPVEPPVDYFQERTALRDRNLQNGGHGPHWALSHANGDGRNFYSKTLPQHEVKNSETWRRNNGITSSRKQWDCFNQHSPRTKESSIENVKLPRMIIRDSSPRRVLENRWNVASNLKPHERRSRSHDDSLDNENTPRSFRKADKSVSTDDLNFNQDEIGVNMPHRLFKRSRDIATQCYGTLSKGKGPESASVNLSAPLFTRPTLNSSGSNGGIINVNNPKVPRPSLNNNGARTNGTVTSRYLNKINNFNDRVSENSRVVSKLNGRPSNNGTLFTNGRNLNSNIRKNESQANAKFANGNRFSSNGEPDSVTYDYVQSPVRATSKAVYPTRETRTAQPLNSESPWKGKGNNRAQDLRPSATVGYVRGRQIPLNEVNTTTNRKLSSRNEINKSRNPISVPKTGRGLINSSNHVPNRVYESMISTEPSSKKYLSSNFESGNGRNYNSRNVSSPPPKNCNSGLSDDTQSMIDWSLSGFQLATHPENRITSISDSECTVHRRPPLLMYIPGVSHHDRPAEDDRLSALSDMSRSELNDDVSPLASSHGMERVARSRSTTSEVRRRNSMPKDGKLKWIKWKNNGQS